MQPQRLFIAVHVPDRITSILEQRQSALRQKLGDAQNVLCWNPRNQFHLTLAFLGEVRSTFVPSITEIIEANTKVLAPQSLQLGKCGLFCRRGVPTVLWSEVQTAVELHSWCQQLRTTLHPHCPHLDDREFHPHITLARIRRGRSLDRCKLKDLFEHDELCIGQQSWECKEIALVQSDHCSKGATHSILQTFNLGV